MYVTCIPVYSKQWKEDDGGLKGRGWGGGVSVRTSSICGKSLVQLMSAWITSFLKLKMLFYDFRIAFEYEYARYMALDTLQYLQIKHERNGGGDSFSFQIFNVFIVYIFAKIAGGVNLFSYYHLTPAS